MESLNGFVLNCDLNEFPDELLNDLLIELNVRNDSEVEEVEKNGINLDKYKSTNGVIQNIITICEIFNQNDCVKYASIELFDKLIVKLICDMKKGILESNAINCLDWELIERKVSKQMHLRAITCVTIASKLYSNKSPITMSSTQLFLQRSGYEYSLKHLNKSELRVLKLFNYKLMVTSVDTYVEVLLAILNHNIEDFERVFHSFYGIAKHLTDLYYMSRNVIIRNAFKIKFKGFTPIDSVEELELARIGANKMVISSAIIACIPILIDVSINERVISELSYMTTISADQIIDMSHAILLLICDY